MSAEVRPESLDVELIHGQPLGISDESETQVPDPIRAAVVAALPEELSRYENYVLNQVVATAFDDRSAGVVKLIAEAVVCDLQDTIKGYQKLGRAATNRESSAAVAFG